MRLLPSGALTAARVQQTQFRGVTQGLGSGQTLLEVQTWAQFQTGHHAIVLRKRVLDGVGAG